MRTLLIALAVSCVFTTAASANPNGRNNRGSYQNGYRQNGYGQGYGGYGGTQVNVYQPYYGQGQLNYYQGGYGNYWPQQGPPRAYYRQQQKLFTSPGWDW